MIEIEVKIIGSFGSDFVSVAKKLALKEGARPQDAIVALYQEGIISKAVYQQVKCLPPPCFLALNDEKHEGPASSLVLSEGDILSIMQMLAGG